MHSILGDITCSHCFIVSDQPVICAEAVDGSYRAAAAFQGLIFLSSGASFLRAISIS